MFRINDRFASTGRVARRAWTSLGLAALLLGSTLGAPTPTLAQDPVIKDHRMGGPYVARVQVIMHSVKIFDDRDGRFAGDGEFYFWYTLVCAQLTDRCLGNEEVFLDGYEKRFSAGSGETYALNQAVPVDGSPTNGYQATSDTGYPLYPGHNYRLRWGMEENDSITDREQMGDFRHHMTADTNWGIGTFTTRSARADGSPGDFELTYEVRPVPMPDLRPVNIKIQDIPGGPKQRVCVAVQNIGPVAANPFGVVLRVNGDVPFGAQGSSPGLTSGNATDVCIETELPAGGPHKIEAYVDPGQAIIEYNEANNAYEQSYTGSGPAPAPSPEPGPILITSQGKGKDDGQGEAQTQSKVDLTVSGIKVNGQVPDGKNDCKDGKNAATIVVKNTGSAKASAFTVRLAVDGGEAIEETVDGLDAGKEREVKLDDVRLKKGAQKLIATADSKAAIAESNEENNERTVTAACGGN